MEERYAQILTGVVGEYVRTAEPVGSVALCRALRLPISPATVRGVLQELDEAGYVYQPHTSSGRIPTDRGFRFFVDRLRERQLAAAQRAKIQREFLQLVDEYEQVARTTAKLLARLSHAVALSSVVEPREVQEAGLSELLAAPLGDAVAALREVSAVIETVESHPERFETAADEVAVFIGREIPVAQVEASHISLVVRPVERRHAGKMMLVVIGPKHMPYGRNVALINAVAEVVATSHS